MILLHCIFKSAKSFLGFLSIEELGDDTEKISLFCRYCGLSHSIWLDDDDKIRITTS